MTKIYLPGVLGMFALITFFVSCAQTRVATVSSENVPKLNNELVFENDTVKITYDFWAKNGIMSFNIYNNFNEPVYFDWKKSAFIPNNKMISYWRDETNTVGTTSASSVCECLKNGRPLSFIIV